MLPAAVNRIGGQRAHTSGCEGDRRFIISSRQVERLEQYFLVRLMHLRTLRYGSRTIDRQWWRNPRMRTVRRPPTSRMEQTRSMPQMAHPDRISPGNRKGPKRAEPAQKPGAKTRATAYSVYRIFQ